MKIGGEVVEEWWESDGNVLEKCRESGGSGKVVHWVGRVVEREWKIEKEWKIGGKVAESERKIMTNCGKVTGKYWKSV